MKTKETIMTLLQGGVMGMAEILPGVSGSTFALIMGIYDDFIHFLHDLSDIGKALLQFMLKKKKWSDVLNAFNSVNWKFGITLGIGMLIAIALLSNIVGALIEEYPQYVSAFFFGLVLASVSIPWREMTQRGSKQFIIIIFTALATFLLLSFDPVATRTDPSYIMLFFGGIVGISGMVLPGISGSFILLLLGLYEYIIGVVKSATRLQVAIEDIVNIGVFILGLISGFVLFVRLLKKGLDLFPNELMAALVGLMIGSLRALYPFFIIDPENEELRVLISPLEDSLENIVIIVSLAVFAALIVLLLNKTTDREQFKKLS